MAKTTRYYMQMTTGRLHARRGCGVTRRTRYAHTVLDLTPMQAATYPKCAKCAKP